jgi:hypothetical protein
MGQSRSKGFPRGEAGTVIGNATGIRKAIVPEWKTIDAEGAHIVSRASSSKLTLAAPARGRPALDAIVPDGADGQETPSFGAIEYEQSEECTGQQAAHGTGIVGIQGA